MELLNKKIAAACLLAFALSPVIALAETPKDTGLTDNQIAEIMQTANMAEVDAAKVAKERGQTQQIKDFAEHMIVEHKQNSKDAKALEKKVDIKPKSNTMAKDLKKDAKMELADVKKLKGLDFDKAYIKMQITMHQQLLNDLDQKLIPAAKNEHFKEYLQTTREHVVEHLSKAQNVQIDISKN
jgi:putative membrane protein